MSQIKDYITAWRQASEIGLEYREIIDQYPTLFKNTASVLHDFQEGIVPSEIETQLRHGFRTAESKTWRGLYLFHKRELHEIHVLSSALEELLALQVEFHHAKNSGPALSVGVRLYTAWLQKTNFQSLEKSPTLKSHLLFSHIQFHNHALWQDLVPDDILNTLKIAKALPALHAPTPTFPKRSYRLVHLILRFKICYGATATTIAQTLNQFSLQYTI